MVVYTIYTMKNITLSAPEELIEQARQKVALNGTTLNSEFRLWLETLAVNKQARATQYKQLLKLLGHVNAGRKFTRAEMNQRS